MADSKFKRLLWALNEFLHAPATGISMKELSDKWAHSSMNDDKDEGIPERTFHRIRRTLESTFGIVIVCIRGAEPRYRISNEDLEPGSTNLLSLFLNKAQSQDDDKAQPLRELLNLLINGNELTADDKEAVKTIAYTLRRIPYEYGTKLIHAVKDGEMAGADSAAWDSGYSRYVCVWDEDAYKRSDVWLSIGFYDDRVRFYFVSDDTDEEHRQTISEMLGADEGEQYRHGYWWYEPTDKSLFQLRFDTVPDMQEVKRRIEVLQSKIAAIAAKMPKTNGRK